MVGSNTLRSKDKKASFRILISLVKTLIKSHSKLSTIVDYPKDVAHELKTGDTYDFIVVGSGSAGSIVATRLAENDQVKVLLIERGGYPSPDSNMPATHQDIRESDEDWDYHTEASGEVCAALQYGVCKWPSGKILGGSGAIDSMLHLKGSQADYAPFDSFGIPHFSYKSIQDTFRNIEGVNKYKQKLRSRYGTEGYLKLTKYFPKQPIAQVIMDAAEEMKVPVLEDEDFLGFFTCYNNIHNGLRVSASKAYLRTTKNNLSLCLNTQVNSIIMNKDTKEAKGVVADINGKKIELLAKNEVIISAGSIQSPVILMRSGIGPRSYLESIDMKVLNDLPVGENLQDHLAYPGLFLRISRESVIDYRHKLLDEIYKYYVYRKGLFCKIGLSNIIGLVNTRPSSSDRPNIKIHHNLFLKNDIGSLTLNFENFGFNHPTTRLIFESAMHNPLLHLIITLTNPKSRGRIILSQEENHEKPKIIHGYYSDQANEDLEVMLEGVRWIQDFVTKDSFHGHSKGLVYFENDFCKGLRKDSDEYWKTSLKTLCGSMHSPVGTCKMGTDDTAVVDPYFKVLGIKNLRVIDASVIPRILNVGASAATMMLAEKGAQLIKKEHKL